MPGNPTDPHPAAHDRAERARALRDAALARIRSAWAMDDFAGRRAPLPREGRLHRALLLAGVVAVTGILVAMIATPGAAIFGKLTGGLADKVEGAPGEITLPAIAQRSVVLARDGRVLATLAGQENRKFVPLADIPPVTQQAVLAIEDAQFYEHKGVALGGLLRALLTNVREGAVRQGGSTITQQLIKNALVGTERTVDRKIREAQLAIALEKRFSKRQILELYLNEAYFGNGVYGVGTAAEFYFGRPVQRITLAQSALLAGLLGAPERYEPIKNAKAAKQRRALALKRMADEGFIPQAEAARLAPKPLGARAHALEQAADDFFVAMVKQDILQDPRFGATRQDRARAIFQSGLRIETTLDLDLQKHAQAAVDRVLDRRDDPDVGLASIDPKTGALRAMVGGRDFDEQQFNAATQGGRQAGSAFKPFTLVAALLDGLSPGLEFEAPAEIELPDPTGEGPWPVANYDGKDLGVIDMRRATELSVNTYYAQLVRRLGPQKVVDVAKKMGITSPLRPFLSIALGTFDVAPLEVASAYATLASGGVACRPYWITRVTDAAGQEVMRATQSCKRAIDKTIAAQATSILRGVIERGTGRANARIGRPAAGKTGTTDFYTDAWFAGYTPQFATAVWMGFIEGTEKKLLNIHGLPKVYGGSLPAMIWARYMRAAHRGLRVESFPQAPGARTAAVPDVVGIDVAEATEILESAGFGVRTESVRSRARAGRVTAQDPGAGARPEAGAMVTLSVSDGKGAAEASPSPTPTPSKTPTPAPTPSPSPTATET